MRLLPSATAAVALLALTGCARAVSLPVAEDAADPHCASVIVALPEAIGADASAQPLERRDTTAQATAAWGDPSAVTLRCGVPEPAPSTERCVTVGEVDWLTVAKEGDTWTFVSYGRSPATEVVIDTGVVTGASVLDSISSAVARTELVGACS